MSPLSSVSLAIVIPVYNEVKALPEALKCLGSLVVNELIFVDGGSTDESRALIEAHGYTCLLSEAGRAKQMNMGARYSKSDIILFLHIDTSLSSSNISNIKKTYNQGFLSGRFNIRFSNDRVTYRIISFFINVRSCLTKISTGDQGMFVRRDVFERLGGFPVVSLMEDVILSSDLRKQGKVACLKDTVTTSSRRWEQRGVIKTILLMWKLRLFHWFGTSPERLARMYKDAR